MRYTFALCIFALFLIIVKSQSQYPVNLVKVLTERVPSDGMLIFDSAGFSFPLYDGRFMPGNFRLSVINEVTQVKTDLDCFLYQFEGRAYLGTPKVGCLTRNLEVGDYYLAPFEVPIPFYEARTRFVLQPFSGQFNFTVFKGSELYFYEDDGTPDEEFEYRTEYEDIDFDLFEYVQTPAPITIYFDQIPVGCRTFGAKLRCSLRANQFDQVRYKRYNVFLKDSENNVKRNYFVNPVSITLEYLY